MNVKVIWNSRLIKFLNDCFSKISGMEIEYITWGNIIRARSNILPERDFIHEYTHVKQFEEYGKLDFCMRYIIGFVVNLFHNGFNWSISYSKIKFELEAVQASTLFISAQDRVIYQEILKTAPPNGTI
jgi:hypothetical protein